MKRYKIIAELKIPNTTGNNKFWQEHETYCHASTLKSARACMNEAHIVDEWAYCNSNDGIDKIYDYEIV